MNGIFFFFQASKQAVNKKKNPQKAEVTGHLLASGTEVMESQVVLSINDTSEPGIPLGFLMWMLCAGSPVRWSEHVHVQETAPIPP